VKGENGDRGFIGERKSAFWLFFQIAAGCRACRSLRFPHLPNETKPLPRQSLDEALLIPGIAITLRTTFRRVVSAASDTIRPFQMAADEVVFADNALPVPDQVVEQVEYLWRDGDDVRSAIAARAGQCRLRSSRRCSASCHSLRRPQMSWL